MHKIINVNDIGRVSNEPDCDVVIVSGAWGSHFLNHYFNNIQRNHQLCLDKSGVRCEYAFLTTHSDYNMYKDRFTIPNITFIFFDASSRLMGGIQMDYAYTRGKPMICFASDCLHTTNLIPNLMNKYADHGICGCMSQRVCYQILDLIRTKEAQIGYDNIFEPREFMKLCLLMLYPSEKRYFADNFSALCNGIYFPVRKDGILIGELIRAFHVGIIYVKNPQPGMGIDSGRGIDSNPFMGRLVSPDAIGMIDDSDDGFCVDVSTYVDAINTPDAPGTAVLDPATFRSYLSSVRGNGVLPVHESLMGFNTVLHSEPLDKSWLEVVEIANNFITNTYGGEIKNKDVEWRNNV